VDGRNGNGEDNFKNDLPPRRRGSLVDKRDLELGKLFKQNERRIYYQLQNLNITDTHQDFFQEGLTVVWDAYQTYQIDKGPLATFFNYTIRQRMIDLLQKKHSYMKKEKLYLQYLMTEMDKGHFCCPPFGKRTVNMSETTMFDDWDWQEIKSHLSDKQWIWLRYYIIEGFSLKKIAAQEKASIDTVKTWGIEARKKLRKRWGVEGNESS